MTQTAWAIPAITDRDIARSNEPASQLVAPTAWILEPETVDAYDLTIKVQRYAPMDGLRLLQSELAS